MRTWTPPPPAPSPISSSSRRVSSSFLQISSTDSGAYLTRAAVFSTSFFEGFLSISRLRAASVTAQVLALLLDAYHHPLSVLGRGLVDLAPDASEGIVDVGRHGLGGGESDVGGGDDEGVGRDLGGEGRFCGRGRVGGGSRENNLK